MPYAPTPSTDPDDRITALQRRVAELERRTGGARFVDGNGKIVVSPDTESGVGLGRPWLPMGSVPVLAANIPASTSAAYVTVWSTGPFPRQSPSIALTAYLLSNSAGVGDAQWLINGAAIVGATALPITNGIAAWQTAQVFTLPGAVDDLVTVDLQVRRTNASGSVGAVFVPYQRQA